jgi:peptidoglycan-associated lipoprotein
LRKEIVMTRRPLAWIAIAASLNLFAVACAKKTPPPADLGGSTVSKPSAPAEDVSAKPRPEVSDKTQDPLAGDIAAVNEYLQKNGLLGDVYFEFDKADLTEESRARLARNAEWLRSNPQFTVTIEGHCDERGTNEYNLALGERRASAARDYVGSLGVAPTRLRTISYGEERPKCMESTEGCWSLNRRASFLVTGRTNVG